MSDELTRHEGLIADDLIAVIDYTSRVLITATHGSAYQLDKAHALRAHVDRLIRTLIKATVDRPRGELIAASIEPDLRSLGRVLLDTSGLGGTA